MVGNNRLELRTREATSAAPSGCRDAGKMGASIGVLALDLGEPFLVWKCDTIS
jgi:hypothetical protein